MRRPSFSTLLLTGVVLAAMQACSSPDPNALLAGDPQSSDDPLRGNGCKNGHNPRCVDGGAPDASPPGEQDAGSPGTIDAAPPPPPAPDAGTTLDAGSGAVDAAPPPPPPPPPPAPDAGNGCLDGVASPGSGHHNAGQDCLSCHANLGSSLQWTVAGTLFDGVSSSTPISGATIEVVDAKGQVLRLPTYDNGNFYTLTPVAFPLTVRATKCPANTAMSGSVSQGSCNACHGSAFRIHL